MRVVRILFFSFLWLLIFNSGSKARKGFTIEGGLIYDHPASHSRPYTNMKGGFGFTGNLGFDFLDWAGFELGVIHSSHKYELGVHSGAVLEESADKTTFFLKARAIPFRRGKFEFIAAAGVGFFDLAGKRLDIAGDQFDEDFSGLGFTGNFDFRYNITDGLAASLYLGSNFINYSRYEILGYKADFGRKLPSGNSINWGLTLYHYIGIPQI
jgi:hypothetical protein